MEIPIELRTAIETELSGIPVNKLTNIVSQLSERYRKGNSSSGKTFFTSKDDIIAYSAFRMPATYGAVFGALSQLKEQLPNWTPNSILDVGAGPGTVMWSATSIWEDIKEITLIEREEGMVSLGKRLAMNSSIKAVQEGNWQKYDITKEWDVKSHDLVISSYVLNELDPIHFEKFITKLWNKTNKVLAIIEPGTPTGYARINKIREYLIQLEGKCVAPCPHDEKCPIKGEDWCHFSQRISRSKLHRQVKSGELSYEDEKFSFICISKSVEKNENIGRIIRHPQIHKGYIKLDLCTREGIEYTTVTKKDNEVYKLAKKLKWGDTFITK